MWVVGVSAFGVGWLVGTEGVLWVRGGGGSTGIFVMSAVTMKLNTAKVKAAGVGLHNDGAGLYLQLKEGADGTLHKSWLFRFKLAGRSRVMGLGPLHTVGLAEAREKAREARLVILAGGDPIEAKGGARSSGTARKTPTKAPSSAARSSLTKATAASSTTTFERAAIEHMARNEPGWRNAAHRAQWHSTLRDYAFPTIGKKHVDQITTNDVLAILQPIWTTKNETAVRLRGRIEAILDAAKVRGHRSGENPARWGGHLALLLPARSKAGKRGHHPALPWSQVPAFVAELRTMPGLASRALEFAILTAARTGELRGMTWDEVSGDVWTIPGARMKGGKEHRVPLVGRALAILQEFRAMALGDVVFPGEGGDSAISNMTLLAVIKRMNAGCPRWVDPKEGCRQVTAHGFRSSFRDWGQEATDFPDWLLESALAHASGDKVEAAYRRGDALEKRRGLMEAWAAFCETQAAASHAAEAPHAA